MAFPFAPVGVDAVGGSEQILALLDRGITAAGHRSIVVARAGSSVAGELVAPNPNHGEWRGAIAEVMGRGVDVVHMHGMDFAEYLPDAGPAVLATLHLPVSFYSREVFAMARPRTWLNCVSQSQLRTCPASPMRIDVVENGVRVGDLGRVRCSQGGYVIALGRICPEKGFHLAIEAAERAGVPLWIAGEVFPYDSHVRYWEEELRPKLYAPGAPHRFLGRAGFEEKARLLAGARCLLAPSTVAETSSLVTMEAMACGTPVVAFRSGALPELIEEGRTGFVVDDVQQMSEAIGQAAELDREECRNVARSRFDSERMIARYLEIYDRLRTTQTEREPEGAGVAG